MALSTASNWLWNFLLAFFTPFIVSAIDFQYGYVFAGCNVLGGLLIYFFVIEGQGRTLEEVGFSQHLLVFWLMFLQIDTMYLSSVVPWKSSSWTPPPPEEIARIRRHAGTHDAALAEGGEQVPAQGNGEAAKESLESGETGGV